MVATIVYVHVKPSHVDDFIKASLDNARNSAEEPGNLRFDVLQAPEDPCRFVLYEAYVTPEHAAAHKNTPHYLEWREAVSEWMAAPRQGVTYNAVFP